MNLGELFFSTGFKVENADAPAKIEKGMAGIEKAMTNSAQVMEKVSFILGEMALKMGAINEESLDMLNATDKTTKKFDGTAKVVKKKSKSFKNLVSKMRETSKGFNQLISKNKWVKAGFVASTAAAVAFTKKMGDMALSLEKTAYFTGVDTQKLQILGDQMKQVGGNADSLYSTIEGLRDTITDIELGKGDMSAWGWLGIDPQGKDPLTVLDELKGKIGTIRNDQLKKFSQGLGVDKDTLFMLKEMSNLQPVDPGTLVPQDELKALSDFSGYSSAVFSQWSRVIQRLGAKLVPFVKHVVYAFDRVGSMIHGVFNAIKPLEPYIEKVFVGMALIAGIVAAKMFPLTATIVALGLAFEDLYTFINGGDSLLGRFIEQFSSWDNVLKMIIASLGTVGTMIDSVFGSDIGGWFADAYANIGTPEREEKLKKIEETNKKSSGMSGHGLGGFAATFNISGAGNPEAVAEKVLQKVKKANTNAGVQRPAAGY